MRLVSLYFWVGFWPNVIGASAATDSSTRTNFPPECISTFRVTTKVAGRTVTSTLIGTHSTTSSKSYNATTSPKNVTLATDIRYGKLWRGKYKEDLFPPDTTSTTVPTILCSSIAEFSSSCSCASISHVTITSTIRSSTTTVTRTGVASRLGTSSYLKETSRWISQTSGASKSFSSSPTPRTSQFKGTAQPRSRLTGTSPDTNSILPTGRFLNTTVSSTSASKSPVVYVVNTTTLITVTTAPKHSISAGISLPQNTTIGRWLNTTTPTSRPSQGFRIPFWRLNITAPGFFSRTNASLPAHKVALVTGTATGTGLSPLSNFASSQPLWLNTTRATTTAALTTGPRLFTANATFTFANTTVRWANTTTSSSVPTPTPTFPTSCGKSAAPFSLQISSPSTPFDNWFVQLSARALLFSSRASQASRFSVEAGGYLCIVGLVDETEEQRPYVAAMGVKEGQRGEIWMVSKEMLDIWGEDYVPLGCMKDGGLSCGRMKNRTDVGEVREWVGCGMQLGLGSGNGTVAECGNVGVSIVDAGGSNGEDGVGEMRLKKRMVNPWAFIGASKNIE